ncbi:MAG: hypothetical protein KF777_09335 [Planctomycetaceae bacterium]|nr:hypothetical protein [Planctomycetaceae bacterium]
MPSFFFWLTMAAAMGALVGTLMRPGFPEIVLSVIALNAIFYGFRNALRARRRRAAV